LAHRLHLVILPCLIVQNQVMFPQLLCKMLHGLGA